VEEEVLAGARRQGIDVSQLISPRTKIHTNVLDHYRHGDLEARHPAARCGPE
jgi:hypothetical protein